VLVSQNKINFRVMDSPPLLRIVLIYKNHVVDFIRFFIIIALKFIRTLRLIISNDITLDLDFTFQYLFIKNESSTLIKQGGKLN